MSTEPCRVVYLWSCRQSRAGSGKGVCVCLMNFSARRSTEISMIGWNFSSKNCAGFPSAPPCSALVWLWTSARITVMLGLYIDSPFGTIELLVSAAIAIAWQLLNAVIRRFKWTLVMRKTYCAFGIRFTRSFRFDSHIRGGVGKSDSQSQNNNHVRWSNQVILERDILLDYLNLVV